MSGLLESLLTRFTGGKRSRSEMAEQPAPMPAEDDGDDAFVQPAAIRRRIGGSPGSIGSSETSAFAAVSEEHRVRQMAVRRRASLTPTAHPLACTATAVVAAAEAPLPTLLPPVETESAVTSYVHERLDAAENAARRSCT